MKSVSLNGPREGQSLQNSIRIQASPKEIHFRAGQVFQGKVVNAKPHGFIQVTTGGTTFKARTAIPLREGKSYSFQVKTAAPRIELKVVREDDPTPISAGKLWVSAQKERLQFVPLLRDLASSPSLKDLGKFIPLLLYNGPAQEDPSWFSQSLLSSGMFWENKVFRCLLLDQPHELTATLIENDLKGTLLFLKKKMENFSSPTQDTQTAMEHIDRLLSFLDDNQTLNINILREGWGWYWFIPGAGRREFLHGELFGRREESGDLHHLHMNLSFSRLGEIHVDCVLRERGISLSIQVTNERIGRFLEGNIGLLEKGIEKQGLAVKRLACEVVPDGSPFNLFSQEMTSSTVMDMVI
jgi:hypothetical protein